MVPQSANTAKQNRRRRHESSDTDQQEEAEVMTVEEDDTADPTWTPSEGGESDFTDL